MTKQVTQVDRAAPIGAGAPEMITASAEDLLAAVKTAVLESFGSPSDYERACDDVTAAVVAADVLE
ncbi:MAG: hypothetical protein WA661_14970, partial [Xanthobacteraceae bacterium]